MGNLLGAYNNKTPKDMGKLKVDKPTVSNTQERNVIGRITTRHPTSIDVHTEYVQFEIELDNVEINFVPQKGDCVLLVCDVQLDDELVDKKGEILQVTKVSPLRLETDQKCVVKQVLKNLMQLGGDVYVLKTDIPSGTDLHLGDLVRADLIRCQFGNFRKRAIKLTRLEKDFGELRLKPIFSSGALDECQSLSVIGPTHHVSTEPLKGHRITLKLRNNIKRDLHLKSVIVPIEGKTLSIKLSVIEPLEPVVIVIGGEVTLILEVTAMFLGEACKKFYLNFDNITIRRTFAVVVCETDEEALKAERRLAAAEVLSAPGRTPLQRSRHYANRVWSGSNAREVVPGEGITPRYRFVSLRLASFEVPDKLRQIYLSTQRRLGTFEAIEHEYPWMTEQLNVHNYVQVMSLFLHLEEIEYFVGIRNYDRARANFQRNGEYLSLIVENLAERRPSLITGDKVRAFSHDQENNNKAFEGIVHRVLFDRVLLKFNAAFQEKYNGEDYRLEFYFSRYGLRKQHHAISKIVSAMGEDFLFPTKVIERKHPQLELRMLGDEMYMYDSQMKWFNLNLNVTQKRAVFHVLSGKAINMPYIIFGPPGTGKTMTLVEVVLQLAENVPGARILLGTPSNSSADSITKRIVDSNVLPPSDFMRLVSFNQIEKDVIPPELMSFCGTVDMDTTSNSPDNMYVTESGLKMRCPMEYIRRRRVLISTNSTLGNFLQMGFPAGHFTHVVIDEAGQCTEPDTAVPISMLVKDTSQVILAGDPRQLQAVVTNCFSIDKKLARSFLERLLDRPPYKKDMSRFPDSCGYNPMCLTKLLNNYRALPSIMCTYSRLFYDNELIPMVSDGESRELRLLERAINAFGPVSKDVPTKQAAFFFGIDGTNMQDPDSPSWYNPQEAKEVFYTTCALYRANIHEDQIGILTPYAKQVKTIRNLFINAELDIPKIGSVEEFQGQERDIMLISTVRSTKSLVNNDTQLSLGFVKSSKRMNVAISRARAMMVVFGNPHLLVLDDYWRRYITFCVQNCAYFGCDVPECILSHLKKVAEKKEK